MKVTRDQIDLGWSLHFDGKVFPATVPGTVHTDLIAAGEIRDIRIDGNEAEMAWIGSADFTYRTTIKKPSTGDHHELYFHGLDTLATVSINGVERLATKNMHRSYSLDLTTDFLAGDIELSIKFAAPLTEAIRLEKLRGPLPNPYNRPYNILRKMACSFGWDWGPITLTSGIWKPVELISWSGSVIDSVQLNATSKTLAVTPHIRGAKSASIRILDGERVIYANEIAANERSIIEVDGVQLWRVGRGRLCIVEITTPDDQYQSTVGFRDVAINQEKIGERTLFSTEINGERIWLKGVNWIPDDPFPHRITRDQYQAQINNLKELGVNAIRIWGGGIYESEIFYDICNREGILVWQDFLFACAAYSEDPESYEEVRLEARENIARLTKHPSLFMWCGNNECLEGHQNWGWEDELQGRPWGADYYFDLLPALVQELDGERPYIPGSPFAPESDDVMSELSGTNHIWDVWNRLPYQRYEEYSPSLSAEFGYNGPGSWPTLMKSLGTTDLEPTSAGVIEHQKAFKGMENIANGLAWEFQRPPTSGKSWYFASQLVQARAVEIGVKHFRTLYATCSGTFLWQFNDMWPVLSWAIRDSAGAQKLAWYSLQSAYKSIVLHFDGVDRALKILNENASSISDTLILSQINSAGKLDRLELDIEVGAHEVFDIELPFAKSDGSYLIADFAGMRTARKSTNAPAEPLGGNEFSIGLEVIGSTITYDIRATDFIFELCALPELIVNGAVVNHQRITLLPGESTIFTVQCATESDAQKLANSSEKIFYSQNDLVGDR